LAFRLRTGLRHSRRLRAPTGFWIHLNAATDAEARRLFVPLRNVLPRVRFVQLQGGWAARQRAWLRDIASIRWRAGLVLSIGERPVLGNPDLVATADRLGPEDVVRAMVARTSRRLGIG
jgi:hypothetical protein